LVFLLCDRWVSLVLLGMKEYHRSMNLELLLLRIAGRDEVQGKLAFSRNEEKRLNALTFDV